MVIPKLTIIELIKMFHWNQIWKHMRTMTNKDIEKRAIWELIGYFENQIDLVIKQSVVELNSLNKLNKIQGLDPKSRIDKECVRNAINTIISNSYCSMSGGTGIIAKRERNFEKHSQNLNAFTEVIK